MSGAAAKKRKKSKKDNTRNYIIGAVGVLFVLLVYWLMQPLKGSFQYGVCKSFAQTLVYYLPTFTVVSTEDFDQSLRILYSHIDQFGQNKMDLLECDFAPSNNEIGMVIESATLNREPVEQKKIDDFNQIISVLLVHKPDLAIYTKSDFNTVYALPGSAPPDKRRRRRRSAVDDIQKVQ
jgi:hypothetical protein